MKFFFPVRQLVALFLAVLLSACGGGGGGSSPTPPVVTAPDPSTPYAIPGGLWSAPSGAAPASGNYVYLQSDNGDFVGGGRTYSYRSTTAVIRVTNPGLGFRVSVEGNQNWTGDFRLPSAAGTVQAGYFKDLPRTFSSDAAGGLDWNGDGRGCNVIKGWIVVDKVVLTGGAVTALDMRFEQHCEDKTPALHGQIHWTQADDGVQAAGPAAIPAGLWQPAAGLAPASGTYLYLENPASGAEPMHWAVYTKADATFTLSSSAAHLGLQIAGDQNWSADFQGMQGLPQLAVGYYAGLQRYPFHNPVLGGLSVTGPGGGCNTLTGWFAVDKITYSGTTLTAVDLRFEQFCDGSTVPLRGQLHWTSSDTAVVPGPQDPPPAGLWAPDPASLPPMGNYVYLVSDPGEYIGGGRTILLTPGNGTFSVTPNLTAALRIAAGGFTGNFVGMNTLSQLQPGYYGNLQRYPFHNTTRGGLDWSAAFTGCSKVAGWFVVDKVSYALGELTAIDLRFEQHCDDTSPALHGAIHWTK
jgi:hypothetical protein